jgi:hypothetical protein
MLAGADEAATNSTDPRAVGGSKSDLMEQGNTLVRHEAE